MLAKLLEKLSLRQQMYLAAAVPLLGLTGLAAADIGEGRWALGALVVAVAVVSLGLAHFQGISVGRRAERIVGALKAMAQGDLTHRVDLPGKDEMAWMAWEYSCARKAFKGMVGEIEGHAASLAEAARQLSAVTEETRLGVVRQKQQTEQVASAMTQMAASVQEVARNAASAASGAVQADQEAELGHRMVRSTLEEIDGLATEVQQASEVIARLKDDSEAIGAVMDVIRDIAEQTNLLALNAAIEAARAGEQGRGFAVVADEVRSLATRTRESTQEIRDRVERLQVRVNDAVLAMNRGHSGAQAVVQQAAKAGDSLASITRVVDAIKDMNVQISGAAEQQHATAEEISRNVETISDIAVGTAQGAEQTASASDDLTRLAQELQGIVGKFRLAA